MLAQFFVVPGVTLASSVRRKPNAFNLVHQLELMVRSGVSGEAAVRQMQAVPFLACILCVTVVSNHIPP